MSQFTAKVRRLSDLPYQDLCNLIGWSTSSIDFDNESLLVGTASNERGEAVAYLTAELTLLVSGYALSPEVIEQEPDASKREAGQAGDAIDRQLASIAEQLGVSRLLLIVPSDAPPQPGELRIIERTLPSRFEARQMAFAAPSPSAYIN